MKNRVYFASRRAFNLYSAIKDFYGGCISSTKKFLSDKNGAASCYSRQKMARFLPQKPALPSLPSLGKGPLSSGRGLASCLVVLLTTNSLLIEKSSQKSFITNLAIYCTFPN